MQKKTSITVSIYNYLGCHVGGEDGEEAAGEGEPDDEAHAHDAGR